MRSWYNRLNINYIPVAQYKKLNRRQVRRRLDRQLRRELESL